MTCREKIRVIRVIRGDNKLCDPWRKIRVIRAIRGDNNL